MASPKAANGISEASNQTFPIADVENELNPGQNTKVEVDPVSSAVAASLEVKEQTEAAQQQKEREKDAMQSLKSAILISAAVVAVAGAIFAITRKLREK
ncbi:hypothetical protein EUGRSUZ_A02998 [Eucalyptus grandis]|uniref:Uncharacterized protein n=2 Tax=Eucalyptus grandis TaxID=71139 RepID=A0A059DKN8_EUCGR|nr:hypothetical protein EUGRSUZ_A02998 [Eucalyptus grandis]